MARDREIERYKKALGIAMDALATYADPESYHAVAFMFDRPCGVFAEDFSRVEHPFYDRPMPGKLARGSMRKLAKRFGDLPYYSRRLNDD